MLRSQHAPPPTKSVYKKTKYAHRSRIDRFFKKFNTHALKEQQKHVARMRPMPSPDVLFSQQNLCFH